MGSADVPGPRLRRLLLGLLLTTLPGSPALGDEPAGATGILPYRPDTSVHLTLVASFFDSIGAGGRSRIASQLTFEIGIDRVLSDKWRWDVVRGGVSGFENSPLDRGDKTGLITSRIYTAAHYYPLAMREGFGLRITPRVGAIYGYGLSGPTASQTGWGGLLGLQISPEFSFRGHRLHALGLGVDAFIGNPVVTYAATLLATLQFDIDMGFF